MLHKITLGDAGGDGHEKTTDVLFTTSDEFTDEVLSVNYAKSVAMLGIDPTEFGAEYEDFTIPLEVKEKLRKYGFNPKPTASWDGNSKWWEDDNDWFDTGKMTQIVMFLMGYGFDDFDFEYVHLDAIVEDIGYGLF